MSIASQIQRIKSNIALSYDAVAGKGGQLPQTQNSANLPQAIATIPQGIENNGAYLVQVIDYDGTVLKEARLNEGETFTLPTPPTNHPRLVFETWSSSAPITNNKVTVTNNDILIGPIYDTVSGLTEFDIYVPPSAAGVYGRFAVGGTKDWGDGTSDTANSHTYSKSGFYTIKVDCTGFGGGQYNGIFVQYYYQTPVFRCMGVHCSSNVTWIDQYPFNATWLQYFTLGAGVTTYYGYLQTGGGVKCLAIPPGITSLPAHFMYGGGEQTVVLPYGITSMGDSAFESANIVNMAIPETCLTFGNNCFVNIGKDSIKFHNGTIIAPAVTTRVPFEIVLPDTVTKINGTFYDVSINRLEAGRDFNEIQEGLFSYARLKELDFTRCAQIPTLMGNMGNTGAVIKVPAALYEQWITETNWVDLADYIVPV